MAGKIRLDVALVGQGVFPSREKARRAIMAAWISSEGRPLDKPGLLVSPDTVFEVKSGEKFVGRGGLKLEEALREFGVAVQGRVALDVGASTGGFTDCLLQAGAERVHAIDVGKGQLDWKLRQDSRVIVKEGLNARHLVLADIGESVDVCVADVSFISLTLILPAVFALLKSDADMITLIKPQFELTPDKVGRGGVVREPRYHEEAVERIRAFVVAAGWRWVGVIPSPIKGREGNVEFLAHIKP